MIEKTYWQAQRELDEQSRALMLEWQIDLLPENRREIHFRFQHDPTRCRCFAIEGLQ